jgi:hypothetical protein
MSLKHRAPAVVPVVASYPLIVIALMIAMRPHVTAAPEVSDWAAPMNLGCQINSSFGDQGPAISKDGLSLYFGSMRPGFGASDLWVSQRASVHNPWGPPMNLGALINTAGVDNIPALSRDEHFLFFNSDRAGTSGGADIWVSYRPNVQDDFGWRPPVNLGAGVSSPAFELGASYFENDEAGAPLLFFGRGPTGPADTDIYVSELQTNGTFGEAMLAPELSSTQADQRPSVRFDGLEIFLGSDRIGSLGLSDLWVSTRETVVHGWDTPTNLSPTINTTSVDAQPYIAADRLALFFMSNRPGGCGGFDLYMTTRTKLRNKNGT